MAAVVLTFALLAAGTILSDRSIWVAPERLVTVYRVHGCRCAFLWERALEQQGFSVAMHELESLKDIRKRLRTPPSVMGCHVGEYLGYFVEGHVDPGALRELSRRHPSALGVSTETSTNSDSSHIDISREAGSRVLLVGPRANTSVWFEPEASRDAGATGKEGES